MSRSPSARTVARWHAALRYFRFVRAVGGHANDYDSLSCRLPFAGEPGLLALCAKLDFTLTVIPEGAPREELGRSYSWPEWNRIWHPIRAYPRYALPGFTRLFGLPAFLHVDAATVLVDACGATGNSWEVTQADFRHAARLEGEFARRGIAPLAPAPA
jgi:hypothetical protein